MLKKNHGAEPLKVCKCLKSVNIGQYSYCRATIFQGHLLGWHVPSLNDKFNRKNYAVEATQLLVMS